MKFSCETNHNFLTIKREVNPRVGIFRKRISPTLGFSFFGSMSESLGHTPPSLRKSYPSSPKHAVGGQFLGSLDHLWMVGAFLCQNILKSEMVLSLKTNHVWNQNNCKLCALTTFSQLATCILLNS
jgi:hypothetical protein